MSWTQVAQATAGTTASTYTYSLPSGAPNPGDLDVLCVACTNSVTTPSGWTAGPSETGAYGTDFIIYYKIAGAGEPSTVSLAASATSYFLVSWSRWTGASTSDVSASSYTTSASTASATTSALSSSGELAIAFAGMYNGGADPASVSWSAGFTALNASSYSGDSLAALVAYDSSAGTAAVSPSASWTNSFAQVACLVQTFIAGIPVATSPTVDVADYGAKGDVKVITDLHITSSSTTATSSSAAFTSADTGKYMLIAGGAGSGAALATTITYSNATTVTLGTAAGATIAGTGAAYGSDDTLAFNDAVTAAGNYAAAHQNYAKVTGAPVWYMLASATTKTGTNQGNAQIPLPVIGPGSDPTVAKIHLEFDFGNAPPAPPLFGQTVAQAGSGAMLISALTGLSVDGTYGLPSVIGGPTPQQGWGTGGSGDWNNIQVSVRGLGIVVPLNPTIAGLDFRSCACARIESYGYMPFDTVTSIYDTAPSNSWSTGFFMPVELSNDESFIGDAWVYGAYYGAAIYAHASAQTIKTLACYYGGFIGGQGYDKHGVSVNYWSCELVNTAIQCDGDSVITVPVNIGLLDVEQVNNYGSGGKHVSDPNNGLGGRIAVNDAAASLSSPPGSAILVSGGANCEIIAACQPRGVITAPSVPASGTALQNTFWRHATVCIAGTMTGNVEINGTSTGLSAAGAYRVPAGATITLTYTTAPSWTWTLD